MNKDHHLPTTIVSYLPGVEEIEPEAMDVSIKDPDCSVRHVINRATLLSIDTTEWMLLFKEQI